MLKDNDNHSHDIWTKTVCQGKLNFIVPNHIQPLKKLNIKLNRD
jgi:hypothetical protein